MAISMHDIVKDEDGYEFIVVGIMQKRKLLSLLHESGSMWTSPISECRPTGKKADKDMVFAALKRGGIEC